MKVVAIIGESLKELMDYVEKNKDNIGYLEIHPEEMRSPKQTKVYIMDLVKRIKFLDLKSLYIITNNPYVLGTLNNLLYAYNIGKNHPEVKDIIPEDYWISDCEAYKIEGDKAIDIFDHDLNLIKNEVLDECSTILNDEFNKICKYED